MIHLGVHGATGRMGKRVCTLASTDDRFVSTVAFSRDRAASTSPLACDVIIDFSTPDGTSIATRIAVENNAAIVVGTTGLTGENRRELDDAGRSVPVIVAPNTAIGVVVLHSLVREATRRLGARFHPALSETHHLAKRDAPSGTALRLAEAIREGGGPAIAPESIRSRREADVVGNHEILFAAPEEQLRISHSALSRDVFARGALDAAAWLNGQPAGMYSIESALGLGDPFDPERGR